MTVDFPSSCGKKRFIEELKPKRVRVDATLAQLSCTTISIFIERQNSTRNKNAIIDWTVMSFKWRRRLPRFERHKQSKYYFRCRWQMPNWKSEKEDNQSWNCCELYYSIIGYSSVDVVDRGGESSTAHFLWPPWIFSIDSWTNNRRENRNKLLNFLVYFLISMMRKTTRKKRKNLQFQSR